MSLSVLASITAEMARELAVGQGVCVRPILRRVLDRDTGTETRVPIPCGATREAVCPPCARKARVLRMQRPSKSLTPQQVDDVLTKTAPDRLHHYVVLSLLTGARTEELRALRWEHVHLQADSGIPPHLEVWRSVRADGDTKTMKSRRTLALPARCVEALR